MKKSYILFTVIIILFLITADKLLANNNRTISIDYCSELSSDIIQIKDNTEFLITNTSK